MHRIAYLLVVSSGIAAAQPGPPPSDPPPTDAPPVEPPPVEPPPVTPPPVAPAPEPPPPPPPEPERALPNYEPTLIRFGGFIQPQLRFREDSVVGDDTNGFRLARARLIGHGQTHAGNIELSLYLEGELQPSFQLLDAYGTATRLLPKRARVTVDVGQMRVPISRQNLLHETRLAFVDKALVASIAPDRDLGLRVAIDLPRPPRKRGDDIPLPGVRLIGGVYNGEGPNQVDNADQDYLYVARGELTVIGQDRLAESAFGGGFVTVSGSFGRNKRTGETTRFAGIDVAGAYRGVSASYEYLRVTHEFADPLADFEANGYVLQLNYLLPVRLPPHQGARFELGFRTERIDRNDRAPFVLPGDPNQAVRAVTAVASYYLRMHSLKAQLALTSFKEDDARTASNENATFDNDQLLIQVTYRME